ncbi:DEAD-box ATP-dependent RNA helicase [Musa troglodytarum]|uniref:DEAD-box ATP-dependent RNA helicase n=1 Tax=Musa troglodytarum TaxID=320322 RepID=A0A9E7EV53_9LILI|nr:DEAD-box ATP-dependent RNA helicase [Musa troglodytarum]
MLRGKERSPLVAAAPLGPPGLELRHRASASGAEEQHGATVGRRHPPEFDPEALIIGIIPLLPALPGEIVDLLPGGGLRRVRRSDTLLGLELDVELEGLLEAAAARVAAAAAAGPREEGGEAAGKLGSGEGGGEEEEKKAGEVGVGGVAKGSGDGGDREEESDGTGDVSEGGGDEEGAGA